MEHELNHTLFDVMTIMGKNSMKEKMNVTRNEVAMLMNIKPKQVKISFSGNVLCIVTCDKDIIQSNKQPDTENLDIRWIGTCCDYPMLARGLDTGAILKVDDDRIKVLISMGSVTTLSKSVATSAMIKALVQYKVSLFFTNKNLLEHFVKEASCYTTITSI